MAKYLIELDKEKGNILKESLSALAGMAEYHISGSFSLPILSIPFYILKLMLSQERSQS